MPNCFQLFKKTAPDKAVILQEVDSEMCKHFGVQEHKDFWYHGWYDSIGFSIAMGKDWDWLEQDCNNDIQRAKSDASPEGIAYFERKLEIIKWLKENYNYTAFYQPK